MPNLLAPIRAKGELLCTFEGAQLKDLHETGGYRLKFPLNEKMGEAIIVNTGGGLVGGDGLNIFFDMNNHDLLITNTGAEKIYDAKDMEATLNVSLNLKNSSLYWLPQETILYNGACFSRQLEVKINGSSRLVLAEMMVFGRLLSNEAIDKAQFKDKWRIYQDDVLIHAENTFFEGNLHKKLDNPAIGGGARALGTMLIMHENLDTLQESLRELNLKGVAFSIKNNLLIARILCNTAYDLRLNVCAILGKLGVTIPRTW